MIRLGVCAWVCLASMSVCSAESLPVDPSHTAVVFSWNHRGFSHPVARLEKVRGTLLLDRLDFTKSSVSATMALDGLRTGDADLDKRLCGKSFFDTERFPEITFKSTRIETVGSSTHLRITGQLSAHGITQAVVLDARINKIAIDGTDKVSAGFDADTVLRRSDFNLGRYVPMVSDELAVHITLEAHEN